ncbi:hypothetical protein [Gymnodinialimonas sp.]
MGIFVLLYDILTGAYFWLFVHQKRLSGGVNLDWEKASATATILTLISSTLIGAYGVFLGQSAINQVADFESARIQPLIQITSSRGPTEEVAFINIGFGPAIIESVHLARPTTSGSVAVLHYTEETGYHDIEEFLRIAAHNRRFEDFEPALMGIPRPNAAYAVGEGAPFFTISDVLDRSPEWREEYRRLFQDLVASTMVCVTYRSLDGVQHEAHRHGGCDVSRVAQ